MALQHGDLMNQLW